MPVVGGAGEFQAINSRSANRPGLGIPKVGSAPFAARGSRFRLRTYLALAVLMTSSNVAAEARYEALDIELRLDPDRPLVAVFRNLSKLPLQLSRINLALPSADTVPQCTVGLELNLTLGPAETTAVETVDRSQLEMCLTRGGQSLTKSSRMTLHRFEVTGGVPKTRLSEAATPTGQLLEVGVPVQVNGKPAFAFALWELQVE
jgi:hypothetical protein